MSQITQHPLDVGQPAALSSVIRRPDEQSTRATAHGGPSLRLRLPGARKATMSLGQTVTREPVAAPAAAPDWRRTAVVYQVYPRSFADSNGDGIGDLPGITARLPALADLGVDAVWLSPFYASPQADAGYDVADYRDVDPLFGTLADFDALLSEATLARASR